MQILKPVIFSIEDPREVIICAVADLLENRSIDMITPGLVAEAITSKFIREGEQGVAHWENESPSDYFYAMGWFKGKGWDTKDYLEQVFGSDILDE